MKLTANSDKSSMISGLQYDTESKELFATFKNGGATYVYKQVPSTVWAKLCLPELAVDPDSLGKSFHKVVINKFPYQKVTAASCR